MCAPDWGHQIDLFIRGLRLSPATLFNPWYSTDAYDLNALAPGTRRRYLRSYLLLRRSPVAILVAEALGYQGGRFSGIAMTSERMLMGHHADAGPLEILGQAAPPLPRTSNPARTANRTAQWQGFTEPTATIVWRELLRLLCPLDFVLWNSVPWHPHRTRAKLSNRTPTTAESAAGAVHVRRLRQIYPNATVIAVGTKAREALTNLQIPARSARHPANGGASDFTADIRKILR